MPTNTKIRDQWNQFINFLKSKGLSGNKSLDRGKNPTRMLLDQYRAINPDFIIQPQDVSVIQSEMDEYKRTGKFPGYEDNTQKTLESYKKYSDTKNFSKKDAWIGSLTSQQYFPSAKTTFTTKDSSGNVVSSQSQNYGTKMDDFALGRGIDWNKKSPSQATQTTVVGTEGMDIKNLPISSTTTVPITGRKVKLGNQLLGSVNNGIFVPTSGLSGNAARIASDPKALNEYLLANGYAQGETKISNHFEDGGSFAEAFKSNRKRLGAGKTFEWNGKTYTTSYKEEVNNNEEMADIADKRLQYYKDLKSKKPNPNKISIPDYKPRKDTTPIDNLIVDSSHRGQSFDPSSVKDEPSMVERLFGIFDGISQRGIDKYKSEDKAAIKKVTIPKSKIKYGYEELGTYPDLKGNGKDSLLSYSYTGDNDTGTRFYIGNMIKNTEGNNSKRSFKNVKGVGHFLMDADVLPNQAYTMPYQDAKGQTVQSSVPGKFINSTPSGDTYAMVYKPNEDGTYNVLYKKGKDIEKYKKQGWSADLAVRSVPFSDLNWEGEGPSTGFLSKSNYIPTKSGKPTSIPYKDKNGYSRFSGGSGIFVFKDPETNREVQVNVAGSPNTLKQYGNKIIKENKISPKDLQFLYHDMGSYSAKPKAHPDGTLDYNQWANYNTYNRGRSGAPLIIPDKKENGGTLDNLTTYDEGGVSPFYSTYYDQRTDAPIDGVQIPNSAPQNYQEFQQPTAPKTNNHNIWKDVGAFSGALNGFIGVTSGVVNYFDQKNKQKQFDKSMRDMMSTEGLFGSSAQSTSKGDYVTTGSQYGQFRPNQNGGNLSYKGMTAGPYYPQFALGGSLVPEGLYDPGTVYNTGSIPEPNISEVKPSNSSFKSHPVTEKNTSGDLANIIKQRESGGNYSALPKKKDGTLVSSAVGAYQFLWNTHSSWIKKVTGVKSKEEFLKDPVAQDNAFDYWNNTVLTPEAEKIVQELGESVPIDYVKAQIHFSGVKGARDFFFKGKKTRDGFGTTNDSYLSARMFEEGGIYEMSEEELRDYLDKGGEVEFV